MKEIGILKVQQRTDINTRANKRLRKTGYLPASVYGKDIEPFPVSVRKDELRRVLSKFGRNSVLKLDVLNEKSYDVMVKNIQLAPMTGDFLHAEFHQISLTEEVKSTVAFSIIGRDTVEQRRLIVLTHMDTLDVKGLPQDIPNSIEVDITELQAGESISLADIVLPEGITTEVDSELKVVSVNEPKIHIIEEDIDEEESEGTEEEEGAEEETTEE